MRGFVSTPHAIVDIMVEKLFAGKPPTRNSTLIDPGCGPGAFIAGVLRWCARHKNAVPKIVGYENEPSRYMEATARFRDVPTVTVLRQDFLTAREGAFDYVIGNPPYVPITELSKSEKARFRRRFSAARGRFDLYLLFFEQGLRLLGPSGRLVFITPEKFLYVKTAESLRRILATHYVREIELINEETFGELVTYPTISTVDITTEDRNMTTVVLRDKSHHNLTFPKDGSSLQPLLHTESPKVEGTGVSLEDVCVRISCGVATGRDSVFVQKTKNLNSGLARFALPTVSGRDLSPASIEVRSDKSMLIPYDNKGRLLPLRCLGALRRYLSQPPVRAKLEARTCVTRKPWYAFHDSVPLPDILRPKLLCKDITAKPHFWIDRNGSIVPRHSVYYIVPRDSSKLDELQDFLNGPEATAWLRRNCQRAANGFLRLQSSVLKCLPVPSLFTPNATSRNCGTRQGESFTNSARAA
jgi:adenine-specific DNA-methyltransferase